MPRIDKEKHNAATRAWKAANKEKVSASNAAYRKANRAKVSAYQKKWRAENPERERAARKRQEQRRLMSGRGSRGLPKPDRDRPQSCECCGRRQNDKNLALDHNHDTGAFRGWLCSSCNIGIGCLGDTIDGVERALAYLRKVEKDV
jgi:hypothetical protein